MKKPNFKSRPFLIRRDIKRRRQEELEARKEKQRVQRKRINRLLHYSEHVPKLISEQAPSDFDIITPENRERLLSFLARLTRNVEAGQKVEILFDKTTRLLPAGTLLFVAKIESLLISHPGRITCKYPKDNVVEQLFQHIGLISKLGLEDRVCITAENVKYWHYACATNTDTSGFKRLFSAYSNELGDSISGGLYDSMSEAVTNTINHAYEVTGGADVLHKGWWMFSQYKEGKLRVAIADLGVGIPCSLSKKPEITEAIIGFIKKYQRRKDTYLIEIAVHSERSRTRLPHRGKGLPDMLEFVKQGNVGGFCIFSRHGFFAYNGKSQRETGHDYNQAIPGTLIEWEIALKDQEL